jgi:hypothetical protein
MPLPSWSSANFRLVGIEPEAPDLAEAEGFLVELGGLAGVIAGERDVADLQHGHLPFPAVVGGLASS